LLIRQLFDPNYGMFTYLEVINNPYNYIFIYTLETKAILV